MENDQDLLQEKLAMDIFTSSMYSLNFLRNITVAIHDHDLKSLNVEEFYDQWLKKSGLSEIEFPQIPYSFGAIIGYLYCGILLAKEKWFDLLPDVKIVDASPDWGFIFATYFSSRGPYPTIKSAIRRMRNALGHGNILFNVPGDIQRDKKNKDDFERKATITLHDENISDREDTFDIEISILGLTRAITEFHKIAYSHVIGKS